MKPFLVSGIALVAVLMVATAASAQSVALEDVCVHYKFDETSGSVFADSGPNGNDATLFSKPLYEELPTIDAYDTYYPNGQFGGASVLGQAVLGGANHEIMVDIPTASHMPEIDDTFAVAFCAAVADWGGMDGLIGSYNYNGFTWTIGMQGRDDVNGLIIETSNAAHEATSTYVANCVDASLVNGTFNQFVIQFEGNTGVSQVYINGTAVANTYDPETSVDGFWGSERNRFTLGGRTLDCRSYVPIRPDTFIDDFALIDGTVSSADLSNLQSSGASVLGNRRLLHLAMDEMSGSVVSDSSSYANHGTRITNDLAASWVARTDISPATRTEGAIDGSMEIAKGYQQYLTMDQDGVDSMPVTGEEFTVSFWVKPDEIEGANIGWNVPAVIASWANGDLGFSVSTINAHTAGGVTYDSGIVVRTTDGDYNSNPNVYGVQVGPDTLNLDPTVFHHIAVTVGADRVVTGMYIDGTYYDSDFPNGFGVTDEETAVFGARFVNSTEPQSATLASLFIDDYAVLAGQLTEAQIAQAMANGVESLYSRVAGDANGDGKVDGSDVTILAGNWQVGVGGVGGATWDMGDFNGDGAVDGSDVTILAGNWQHGVTAASAAVPEPSTLILILCGALPFLALRLKKGE